MVKKAAYATPNLLLRTARKERGWTQQQVADRIGAPFALNVSRWEAGTASPSPYYLERLCQVFGKSIYELGLSQFVTETPPTPPTPHIPPITPTPHIPLIPPHAQSTATDQEETESLSKDPQLGMLPAPRNPFFLGREEVLVRLRQHWQSDQAMVYAHPQAISGLGGIGKTQVALEYAYRYATAYQQVFWIRADSRDALLAGFLKIATLLQLPQQGERDPQVVVAAVKDWLNQHSTWLLILDNIDELPILLDFLPSPLRGHLLLTTRAHTSGGLAHRIELETLDINSGPLLLLRRAGVLILNAPPEQADPLEWQTAIQISQELGGLPLALDQAGAYLEETGCSLGQYLELYHCHRTDLLRYRGGGVLDHPDPVATTWAISFDQLERRNTWAANLLRLCAMVHPEAIPEEIFVHPTQPGVAKNTGEMDALTFNQACAVLYSYSLLRRDGRERTLTMHRLVQAVIYDAMSEQEHEQWRERAIAMLHAVFPDVRQQGWDLWGQCERLLPHVLPFAADPLPQGHRLELANLLTRAAEYLLQRAQYTQARPLYLRALTLYEQVLGDSHPDIAYSLQGLAGLYREQSNYQQAEALYQRALLLLEQAPVQASLEMSALLNDLAICCIEQGKYEQGELLLQRALQIDEQVYGKEHRSIASRLNNLACLNLERGQHEQAEPLLQRALQIDEQVLGPEHPELAFSLTNLAECYREQGHYEQAKPLYQRALRIREQALGEFHPQVAYPLQGLANLYRDQGLYQQAEPLYQRALAIRTQQEGTSHTETAESLHDFACLYEKQGDKKQALALYQQALAMREKLLGVEHPHTQKTRLCYTRLTALMPTTSI